MDQRRNGNFTSSGIYALTISGTRKMTEAEQRAWKAANPKSTRTTTECMFGDKALGYIEEKNFERRLGRSLESEAGSRALTWGKLVEARAFELLGLDYKISSQETVVHPHIPFWLGSPDGNKFDPGKTVFDIKCPYTLKSFCRMAECESIEALRANHPDGEAYYWQLVSNGILTNSCFAELIAYVPYQSELDKIRELASQQDEGEQNRYAWIYFAQDNDMPYLLDGGFYKNIHKIRFEIPQKDIENLTKRVLAAGELLVDAPKIKTA